MASNPLANVATQMNPDAFDLDDAVGADWAETVDESERDYARVLASIDRRAAVDFVGGDDDDSDDLSDWDFA